MHHNPPRIPRLTVKKGYCFRELQSTDGINSAGHVPQQRMVQQLAHEGSLLEVLDEAAADEVAEGGAPVSRPLQGRRRVPRDLQTRRERGQSTGFSVASEVR